MSEAVMHKSRKRAILNMVLFVVRVKTVLNRTKASIKKKQPFRSEDEADERYPEVYPLFRSTTQPAVNTSSRSIHENEDWGLAESFSLSPDGWTGDRPRTDSSLSKSSKRSAPECLGLRNPTPMGISLNESEEEIQQNQKSCFFDFTGMSKPYTLTYTSPTTDGNGGKVGGEMYAGRKCSGLTLSHKNTLGARAIIARRASLKEEAHRMTLARMRRQATVETSRKKSPSEERIPQLLPENPAPTSSHASQKYVRRRSSAEIVDNLPSTCGGGDRKGLPAPLTKADKKRMDKLRRNMKELLELFTAVEQDDIGKVRSMLQHRGIDVNGENMDDLTLLDVATMLNHNEVAQLLLKHGAQENLRLSSSCVRSKKLQSLMESAQTKLAEIRLSMKQSMNQSKEMDKQLSFWESRLHMLKKMNNNLDNADLPGSPKNIGLQVASANSLLVTLPPPESNPVLLTRYKIEWSLDGDLGTVEGSILVKDLRRLEVTIPNLVTGCSYYVQVCGGNLKGYGLPAPSHPSSALPSSWREVDALVHRGEGHLRTITELYHEIRNIRLSQDWEKSKIP